MNRTLVVRLPLAVALAIGGTAFAQSTPTPQPIPESSPVAQPASAEAIEPRDQPIPPSACLQATGSRFIASQNERAIRAGKAPRCANAVGRVYTRDDIGRSGRVDVADALRSLDPSVR